MLLVVICKQSIFAVLRMTYLKHNAVLDEEEKSRIVGLCKQYTSLFAACQALPIQPDKGFDKGKR